MAPSGYHIRLQKGITGGFAPPTPSLIIWIGTGDDDSLQLYITRQFGDEETKTVAAADNDALIDELHGILKEIPMASPPGSEDIYGLDTGIAWVSEDLQWTNGVNISGQGESSVQPSSEEKKMFERAVDIIQEIADA
ncbi:uncharacterized protein FRV6_02992 [Fusarium oxysporum]|uniref:Uncharacterized protein n=1 Tax=Fusarium oxysporum TaxID=5507 RepID=A0A2H3SU94_FUSOX|nr:uncharacterized protein FRV6_02992 [Fusarium oxysporum]